jgi:hypothetical protein
MAQAPSVKEIQRGTSMKRFIAVSIAASTLIASGASSVALASTRDTYSSQISLNGKVMAKPHMLMHGTTKYVPIWYVMAVLKSQGIHSTWNGHSWRLTTPSKIRPDLSKIHAGSGSTSIYVNGKLVLRANGVVHTDPWSKKAATYIPVASVEQLLKRLQIDSSWSGTQWKLFTRDYEVKVLSDADKNSTDATYYQMDETLTMNVTYNLTKQGKEDLDYDGSPLTLQERINEKKGVVNGETALADTVRIVKDDFYGTEGQTVEYYTQGSHVYKNAGDGWQELSPQDEQLGTIPVDFKSLTHIQPKVVKSGFQYRTGVNQAGTSSLLDSFLGPLLELDMKHLTSSQRQSLMKTTSVSEQFTVTPTNGKNYISYNSIHLRTKVPSSLLFPGTDPYSEQLREDIASATVDITVVTRNTYKKETVVPPTGLPQK